MFDTPDTLRTLKRALVSAACAAFVTLLLPATAAAWGGEGHGIVATIAERHLSAKARQRLEDLLRKEPQMKFCQDTSDLRGKLVCASTWADWSRNNTHKNTYNWHFVDIWLDDSDYSRSRDCSPPAKEAAQKGTCGLDGLDRSIEILRGDLKDPRITPSQALMFIVHIVGDLHQPFHTVRDGTGGNNFKVRYFNIDTDMHKVWDTKLIERRWIKLGFSVRRYAQELADKITPAAKTSYEQGNPETWLVDAHKLAVDGYKSRFLDGTTTGGSYKRPSLQEKYYDRHVPVAEEQLKRGGVRLAKVLNDALN